MRFSRTGLPSPKKMRINLCQADESLTDTGKINPKKRKAGYHKRKTITEKERKCINMKMLDMNEMNLVNGGILCYTPPTPEQNREIRAKRALEEWQKWVKKEKRKMEGLADIRVRAAEAALKAAMRAQRAEMDIKAAQRAAMGLD